MRRYLGMLIVVLLAFVAVGCPPTIPDRPRTDKKDHVDPPPPESVEQLRPRVEAALERVRERKLATTVGFWTVFHGILGTGLDKTMLTDPKTKKTVRAIDHICDGKEIEGLEFVPTRDGLDVTTVAIRADMEHFAQGHQDQFIAEMAQWGMTREHKFKVAGKDYTFDDFIKHSRARTSVTKNQELSWAIIIIAQYYGTDDAWTNNAGEKLRFTDVVRYELDQSINEAACGGTHRLFGLTWAYHLHLKNGGKKEGVWLDVEKKIAQYKQNAKQNKNADGSCSAAYFVGPEDPKLPPPPPVLRISTTGHIVEWLALAMTDEELRSPWMQYAVSRLSQLILDTGTQPVEGGALYHAAHGLHLYHERVFGTPAKYLPLLPK